MLSRESHVMVLKGRNHETTQGGYKQDQRNSFRSQSHAERGARERTKGNSIKYAVRDMESSGAKGKIQLYYHECYKNIRILATLL